MKPRDIAPDAKRPPAADPGDAQIGARQSHDQREVTPRGRQERVKVLDSTVYLIALDVANELDRIPEGWPADDYEDALRAFWRQVVDEAVTAGVNRHRQASR